MSDLQNLYHGHKVVAMPNGTLGVTSCHERQTSQKADDASSISSYHSRAHSRSSSRGGSISRSRDIVQDVYDRMGVNYVRGRPSIESFLQDNKGLGDATKPNNEDHGTSFQRKNLRQSNFGSSVLTPGDVANGTSNGGGYRPVPRGRVGAQWPPVSNDGERKESSNSKNEVSAATISSSTFGNPNKGGPNERRSMPQTSAMSYLQHLSADHRDEQTRESFIHAPDDEREEMTVVSAKSTKSSVRERIGLFGGPRSVSNFGTGPTNNTRHSYGGSSSTKRSYPPKISIYDSASVSNQGLKDETEDFADAGNAVDQSNCIGGNRRDSGANSVSRRSVADAFLTAISKSNNDTSVQGPSSPRTITRNISIVEIPSKESQANDAASVADSSVSGDDFGVGSPKGRFGKSTPTFAKTATDRAINASTEKQIETRVQSQIAIVTKKFEAEIRRVENRIDQECKARIEALEKKNQELSLLLSQRAKFSS